MDLRRAFRPAASSVWVVTSAHDGVPVGFTAISVASVSIAPPMLSFNVGRASSSLATLTRSGRFAVHLLAADQDDVARRFAADAGARFATGTSWRWGPDGLPEVPGVVTRLSGAVASYTDAGDSLLVLGAVHDATDAGGRALVHVARTFAPAPSSDDLLVGAAP